jgi:hypothetical protein
MTREQIEQEYRKAMKEYLEEEDRIVKRAKEAGILKPGLDSNRELFKDASDRFKKRIQELKDSLDE